MNRSNQPGSHAENHAKNRVFIGVSGL